MASSPALRQVGSLDLELEESEPVKVVVRIRPEPADDHVAGSPTGHRNPGVLLVRSEKEVCLLPLPYRSDSGRKQKRKPGLSFGKEEVAELGREYAFDGVLREESTQDDVYAYAAPLVRSACNGYNATVFAYGHTSSGKTHTMMGPPTEPGVIPRGLKDIFDAVHLASNAERDTIFFVRISYVELYNNTFRNLLEGAPLPSTSWGGQAPTTPQKSRAQRSISVVSPSAAHPNAFRSDKIEVRESAQLGVFLSGPNLRHPVTSVEEALRLVGSGSLKRATYATDCNDHSSRSHAILTVHIESQSRTRDRYGSVAATEDGEGEVEAPVEAVGYSEVRLGKLHLIDLAGSERLSMSRAEGERLTETQNINLSLSSLGDVLESLSRRHSGGDGDTKRRKSVPVPYRNSKLTYFLKDSLGGNSKTLMITTLRSKAVYHRQTFIALQWSSRAMRIQNRTHLNMDLAGDSDIRQMGAEIEFFKRNLLKRETEMTRLQSLHTHGQEENAHLRARLQHLTSANDAEKKELEAKLAIVVYNHEGRLAEHHRQFVTLSKRLHAELDAYQQRCAQQEQEISELRSTIMYLEDLKHGGVATSQEVDSMKSVLEAWQIQAVDTQQELKHASSELEKHRALAFDSQQSMQAMSAQLKEANDREAGMVGAWVYIQSLLDLGDGDPQPIDAVAAEIKQVRASALDAEQLRARVRELEQDQQVARVESSRLLEAKVHAESIIASNAEKALAAEQAFKCLATKSHSETESHFREVSKLKCELEEAQTLREKGELEVKDLRELASSLKLELGNLVSKKATIELRESEMQEEVQALRSQVSVLTAQLARASEARTDAAGRKEDHFRAMAAIQERNQALSRKLADVTEAQAGAAEEAEKLRGETEGLSKTAAASGEALAAMLSQIAAYKTEVKMLRTECGRLKHAQADSESREVENLRNLVRDAEAEVRRLREEAEHRLSQDESGTLGVDLRLQVEDARSTAEELRKALEEEGERIRDLEERLAIALAIKSDAESCLETAKSAHAANVAELQAESAEQERAQEQRIEELLSSLEEGQQRTLSLERANAKAAIAIKRLRNQLQDAHKDAKESLGELGDTKDEEITLLQKELNMAGAKQRDAMETNLELEKKLATSLGRESSVSHELLETRRLLAEEKEKREGLMASVADLETQLAESLSCSEGRSIELHAFKANMQLAREQVAAASEVNSNLRRMLEKTAGDLQRKEEALRVTNAKLEAAQRTAKDMETSSNEIVVKERAHVVSISAQLDSVRQELELSQKANADQMTKNIELEGMLKLAEDSKGELEHNLRSSCEECERLRGQVSALEENRKELKERADDMMVRGEEGRLRLGAIERDLEATKQRVAVLIEEQEATQSDLVNAIRSKRDLEVELSGTVADAADQEAKISELSASLEKALAEVDLVKSLLEKEMALAANAKCSYESKQQRDLAEYSTELQSVRRHAEQEKCRHDTALAAAQETEEVLKEQLDMALAEVHEAKEKIASLECELEEAMAVMMDFEQDNKDLQTSLLEVREQLVSTQGSVSDLEASKSALEDELRCAAQTTGKLESAASSLRSTAASQKVQLEEVLSERNTLLEKLSTNRLERDAAVDEIQRLKVELSSALDALEASRQDVTRAENALKLGEERYCRTLDDLSAEREQVASLQKESANQALMRERESAADLQRAIADIEERNSRAIALAKQRAAVAACKATSDLRELQVSRDDILNRCDEMARDVEHWKARADELRGEAAARREAEARASALERARRLLVEELMGANARVPALESALRESKAEMCRLKELNSAGANDRKEEDAARSLLERTVAELRVTAESAKAAEQGASNRAKALEAEAHRMSRRIATLENAVNEAEHEVQTLRNQLEQEVARSQGLVRDAKAEATLRLAESRNEVHTLTARLEHERGAAQSLAAEVARAQEFKGELVTELQSLHAEEIGGSTEGARSGTVNPIPPSSAMLETASDLYALGRQVREKDEQLLSVVRSVLAQIRSKKLRRKEKSKQSTLALSFQASNVAGSPLQARCAELEAIVKEQSDALDEMLLLDPPQKSRAMTSSPLGESQLNHNHSF